MNKIGIFGTTAVVLSLLAQARPVSASDEPTAIAPSSLAPAGKVSPEFLSYNVEMASVTGGHFWRPYAAMPDNAQKPAGGSADNPLGGDKNVMFMARPPIDLGNRRLRSLAAGLGPAKIRVSGTWANKIYFQKAGDPADVKAPAGFEGVLTRQQWRGVVDFARAVDGQLLTSFAISPGVRDAQGVWTTGQAQDMIDFTRSIGGKIAYAEFFNEPNSAKTGGAPKGYSAADYTRDHAIFRKLTADAGIKAVGPSLYDTSKESEVKGRFELLRSEDLLATAPRPQLDVFSYHHYPAVSLRCSALGPALQTSREDALSPAWFAQNDRVTALFRAMRDQYAPEKPIWVTEIADAACGGNPWGPTFLETFRFADMLGRYARQGTDTIFHNTLIGSEYGLIDEDSDMPTPKYWVALLWRKLMGQQSLSVQSPAPDLLVYAQCHRKRPGGVVLLVVNPSDAQKSVKVGAPGNLFALSAPSLDSRSISLNGRPLQLDSGDRLPLLAGRKMAAGLTPIAAHSVNFIELPDAANPVCSVN